MSRFEIPVGADHLAVRWEPPTTPEAGRAGGEDQPSILYLHGFGADQGGEKASYFRRRWTAAGFGFCSFDFRAHGASSGSFGDLTLSRNLADVHAVREAMAERGVTEWILQGSSMGGLTGLWAGAQEPQGIRAGIHIAPAVTLARRLVEMVGEEKAAAWQETGSLDFPADPEPISLSWDLVEDFGRYAPEDLAGRSTAPLLLFQGRDDDRVPWNDVVDLAGRCPTAELHLFGDGDHRLVDRLDHLWQLIQCFLGSRGIASF